MAGMNNAGRGIAFAISIITLATGCIPPYADFQGARLVGPGRAEVTPFYSAVFASAEGESEKVQDDFGVQVAVGVSDRVDFRFRYERVRIDDEGINILAAGPKFGLVHDRLSLFTPIGAGFGEGLESSQTVQLQPTLLFTAMPAPAVEINASGKVLVWLNSEADNLVAFNLGLGLRPGENPIWFRPELGYLFDPGESGHSFQLGIGLSFVTGDPR